MIRHEPGHGWTVTPEEPPAEEHPLTTVDVALPGMLLTLSLLPQVSLLSVFVAEGAQTGSVEGSADGSCQALFGGSARDLVEGRQALVADATALGALAALADAEQLRTAGASPRLAALLSCVAYSRLGMAAAADTVIRTPTPAVTALARYLQARPALLDTLPEQVRTELGAMLDVALAQPSVRSEGWLRDSYEQIRVRLAAGQLVAAFEDLLAASAAGQELKVAYAGTTADEAATDVTSVWTSEDLRSTLDELAEEFFAGLQLRGSTPGPVDAAFVLRFGAEDRVGDLVARLYSWQGALLGESAVSIVTTRGLPRGSFTVTLDADGTSEQERDCGVLLEIVPAGTRVRHPVELRRIAYRRAQRLARTALELQADGQTEAAQDAWRAAARLTPVLDPGRPEPPLPEQAERPGDPLRALVAAWRRDARDVLQEAAAAGAERRAELLVPVLRDLGRAVAPCEEVAQAYEDYAGALLQSDDPGERDEGQDFHADALRLRYALRDARGASRVLQKVQADDADAGA